MAGYQHGMRVQEVPTALVTPATGTAGLQVVFGTAPINQAKDPYHCTNVPILCYSMEECVEQLGYQDDFKNYTLCQSMDANFRMFHMAPVIFCNVLDPNIHKKENEPMTYPVLENQATIHQKGILLDTVKIKKGDTLLELDTDYVMTFQDDGSLIVALLENQARTAVSSIMVESTRIAPEMVTENDIIGGYDIDTGTEKGLELVRTIYPKLGLVPGLLLAPGWSQKTSVGLLLSAKCESINGLFSCECLLDLDSSKITKYTDCYEEKNSCGYTSKHALVLWPNIQYGEKQYAFSAVFGAFIAYTDATNGDIPNLSPSNQLMGISGTVLEDGTLINMDQEQGNLLNGQGITTAINMGGWRGWGNNTACYPSNTDPKDRWFCCRRFFSWWGNHFILTYSQQVDHPANYRLMESICDSENIRGNSYTAQGKCAGAKIIFLEEENQITDIMNGKIQFHQYLAPFTPAESILNTLEFDPNLIKKALGGN